MCVLSEQVKTVGGLDAVSWFFRATKTDSKSLFVQILNFSFVALHGLSLLELHLHLHSIGGIFVQAYIQMQIFYETVRFHPSHSPHSYTVDLHSPVTVFLFTVPYKGLSLLLPQMLI